jgi:hypothetical protein
MISPRSRTKDTKDSEIDIFESLGFVLFGTFVVQRLLRFSYSFAARGIGSCNGALVRVETIVSRCRKEANHG